MKFATVAAAAAVPLAGATTYFKESFDKDWESRWTVGTEWKPAHEMGKWKVQKGKTGVDVGLQTTEDARFYSATAPFSKEFDNKDKDLVVSYTVKFDQEIDCGGAYLKLVPPGFDAKKFGGDTKYSIMFGPDICGYSTRKTHVIFNYEGQNLLTKKSVKVETDRLPHRYTLIVHPDNTYEVQIDGSKVESGNLADDWDFLKPKTIKDPAAKKPADWVDEAQIPDPEDKKPEGYDDIPAKIVDPAAKKPEDWDEEEDGEWEAPLIDNPEFKGEWKPKMIANPAYKGPWIHPEIANPEYKDDPELHRVCHPCSAVGFELWQVKSGSVFDDIIVTDSLAEAEAFAKETFEAKKDKEKALHEEQEKKKQAEEEAARKKAEEEAKHRETAEKHDHDHDHDEDEDEDEDKDEL